MPWIERVAKFVESLRDVPHFPNSFNPWDGDDPDADEGAAEIRRGHLRRYLGAREHATYMLVGEAPSWHGCRFSGIPLTSERMLLGPHAVAPADIFAEPANLEERTSIYRADDKRTIRYGGRAEKSATVVWRTMMDLNVGPFDFVLWNVVPWHPHLPGDPRVNRTDTQLTGEELSEGGIYLRKIINLLFPCARVIALGRTARVATLLRPSVTCVPHPRISHEFESAIRAAICNHRRN